MRKLIDTACNGEIEFDTYFANKVLSEVFKIESHIDHKRKIVSYLTLPLSYIPLFGTPIQKVTKEVIIDTIQRKNRQEYRWFYMISDFAS